MFEDISAEFEKDEEQARENIRRAVAKAKARRSLELEALEKRLVDALVREQQAAIANNGLVPNANRIEVRDAIYAFAKSVESA